MADEFWSHGAQRSFSFSKTAPEDQENSMNPFRNPKLWMPPLPSQHSISHLPPPVYSGYNTPQKAGSQSRNHFNCRTGSYEADFQGFEQRTREQFGADPNYIHSPKNKNGFENDHLGLEENTQMLDPCIHLPRSSHQSITTENQHHEFQSFGYNNMPEGEAPKARARITPPKRTKAAVEAHNRAAEQLKAQIAAGKKPAISAPQSVSVGQRITSSNESWHLPSTGPAATSSSRQLPPPDDHSWLDISYEAMQDDLEKFREEQQMKIRGPTCSMQDDLEKFREEQQMKIRGPTCSMRGESERAREGQRMKMAMPMEAMQEEINRVDAEQQMRRSRGHTAPPVLTARELLNSGNLTSHSDNRESFSSMISSKASDALGYLANIAEKAETAKDLMEQITRKTKVERKGNPFKLASQKLINKDSKLLEALREVDQAVNTAMHQILQREEPFDGLDEDRVKRSYIATMKQLDNLGKALFELGHDETRNRKLKNCRVKVEQVLGNFRLDLPRLVSVLDRVVLADQTKSSGPKIGVQYSALQRFTTCWHLVQNWRS